MLIKRDLDSEKQRQKLKQFSPCFPFFSPGLTPFPILQPPSPFSTVPIRWGMGGCSQFLFATTSITTLPLVQCGSSPCTADLQDMIGATWSLLRLPEELQLWCPPALAWGPPQAAEWLSALMWSSAKAAENSQMLHHSLLHRL